VITIKFKTKTEISVKETAKDLAVIGSSGHHIIFYFIVNFGNTLAKLFNLVFHITLNNFKVLLLGFQQNARC